MRLERFCPACAVVSLVGAISGGATMCELFAINSRRSVRANDCLRLFYQDSVEHPHGWGLSWLEDDGRVVLHKEPVRAIDSTRLARLLDEPVCSTNVVAHIRNATMGALIYDNCHPFLLRDRSGTSWIIAHNGTILDDRLTARYEARAVGDTDSERAALYLVAELDGAIERKGGPLDVDERFEVLAHAVEELAENNKLNLILDDGVCTYAHTNTVEPTLYVREEGETTTICTRPLDERAGWQESPHNRLVAYCGGRMVCRAARHPFSMDEEQYLRGIAQLG